MQKILRVRRKIAEYKDWFYMPFVVVLGGLMSFGKSSEDRIYMICFIVTTALLGIKLILTDYTWKEIVCIGVIGGLLGWNFLRNGERTLIITFMGIVGAKDVDLKRVFKVALWVKITMSLLLVDLVLAGVVENVIVWMPKNGQYMYVNSYGYLHPNTFFLNIFTIVMLAVLACGEQLRWYAYIIFTLIMCGVYKLVLCRTGIVVWIVFCILLAGLWLASKIKLEKIYLEICAVIPIIMAVLTFLLTVKAAKDEEIKATLDLYLTGRISRILEYIEELKDIFIGNQPRGFFDNMYFYLIYNYGWILSIIFLFAYCVAMWYSMKKGKKYEVLVMGVAAVYGFMEYSVLNMAWNPSVLLMAGLLSRGERKADEHLQQKISDH